MTTNRPLLVGAEATAPSSITIWSAIRNYFNANALPMDYALFSTYDAMGQALLRGEIDIAWNAPMAHAQALIQSDGACRTLAMRDVDNDVRTLIIVPAASDIASLDDLRGRGIALGLPISSELRLIPVRQLRDAGLDIERDCNIIDLEPREYPGGKRWIDDRMIYHAVMTGQADAGVIFEPYLGALLKHDKRSLEDVRIVWHSDAYCHCAFTARPGLPRETAARFVELLIAMQPDTDELREMMQLERLQQWLPAQDDRWDTLVAAIRDADLVGATF